jgi:TolA-binding protein
VWPLLVLGTPPCTADAATDRDDAPPPRVARVNADFLKHLEDLAPNQAAAAEVIRDSWKNDYADQSRDGFVPDALAVLYPPFRAALGDFDYGRYESVETSLAPLLTHSDPFLRANAGYFHARALIERGLLEEAEEFLTPFNTSENDAAGYTPYAPHLLFLLGFSEVSNLRFDAAKQTLERLRQRYPDAPEAVAIGTQQLLLELERRETGNLGEVAGLLDYASARLDVTDVQQRVRQRQDEAVALLDRLIEEAEQQEKSGGGGGSGGGRGARGRKGAPAARPQRGAEESAAPVGPGRIGDLHSSTPAAPGEMWGRMPPAEREKILQSLRDRFPSRYRQLVEQYYRSLAEEK